MKLQNPLSNMAGASIGLSVGVTASGVMNYLPTGKYLNNSSKNFLGATVSSIIQDRTENAVQNALDDKDK